MTSARWALAVRAAQCLRDDPLGLGGLHLRARAGATRDAFLPLVVPPGTPSARLHPDMGDAELFGGLDLTETLRTGRPVTRTGLLQRYDLLILPMAERTTPALAARLGQALDGGAHCLIALDEGADPDEALDPALVDRLGLSLDLDGVRAGEMDAPEPFDDDAAVDDDVALDRLCALSLSLGIASLRRSVLAWRLARASARIDGRDGVTEADLIFATTLALAPFAMQLPQTDPDEAEDTPPPPDPPADTPDQSDVSDADTVLPDGDILLEAALAVLPPDVLAQIAAGNVARATGTGAGATRKGNRRGRPLPSRAGRLDGRARIDLVATLRAAAPWQRIRGAAPGDPVQVRASDIRLRRYETRSDRLVIFAVDASGSAAFARLGEVKGAVELLLAEAYARRDHVALISFRGESADLLLPPTRSLLRTKKELAGLPGGGGTPLAAGLREATKLATQARGRGMDPAVVVLTDGRPNIALSGTPSRSEAATDASKMARVLRASGVAGLVIDAGNRPTPALAVLAREMGAPCLPLPRADAQGLNRAVTGALS